MCPHRSLSLTAFKTPWKLYHKLIHDFDTSAKYAATKPKINRLEGEMILQINPDCHSHYCVTTSL